MNWLLFASPKAIAWRLPPPAWQVGSGAWSCKARPPFKPFRPDCILLPVKAKECYCYQGMANIGSQLTNLPNLVTMGRVLFVPFVLYFMDNYSPVRSLIAAILYLIASVGDGVDGYLARSRGQVSVLGKFLDPVADKLMVTAVMVFMVALGRVPAWLVVVLIARDLAITGLRSIASSEGIVIAASRGGKIKTALQLVGLTMLLVHFRYPLLGLGINIDYNTAGLVVLYLSLGASIISGIDYVVGFFRSVGESKPEASPPE
jgi:CDP-diacylglycerol--glycerol-3-phosphate 3-phosphatidyltransferase